MKRLVGYFTLEPSNCGLTFTGLYLAQIRECVISKKRVLTLQPVIHHDDRLQGLTPIETLSWLINVKVPAVVPVYPGVTKSGKHWVKTRSGKPLTAIVDMFTPIETPADVSWVEDTPFGKVTYYALLKPLSTEIPVVKTVFRSTLEQICVEMADEGDHIRYILDKDYAELLEKYNLVYGYDDQERPVIEKSKLPDWVNVRTVVIRLG